MTQMQSPGQPIDEQDLLALEGLAEAWAEDGGMPLETLDGFFSALVVGPGPVAGPSEYLKPAVGEERVWGAEADVARALGLLVRLWNHIVWRVTQPIPDEGDESDEAMERGFALLPFIGLPAPEGADGDQDDDADPLEGVPRDFPVGALWASGFMQGVALRTQGWEAWMDADEDLLADLQDISRLALVAREQAEQMGVDWEERFDFDERWELLLSAPGLLQDLYLSRIEEEEAVREPIRRAPQPGRNDPCPCGSGRKWKKCCGTDTLH